MKACWELSDGAEDLELLMGERVIGLILLRTRLFPATGVAAIKKPSDF
jgi:hypothetical protein